MASPGKLVDLEQRISDDGRFMLTLVDGKEVSRARFRRRKKGLQVLGFKCKARLRPITNRDLTQPLTVAFGPYPKTKGLKAVFSLNPNLYI